MLPLFARAFPIILPCALTIFEDVRKDECLEKLRKSHSFPEQSVSKLTKIVRNILIAVNNNPIYNHLLDKWGTLISQEPPQHPRFKSLEDVAEKAFIFKQACAVHPLDFCCSYVLGLTSRDPQSKNSQVMIFISIIDGLWTANSHSPYDLGSVPEDFLLCREVFHILRDTPTKLAKYKLVTSIVVGLFAKEYFKATFWRLTAISLFTYAMCHVLYSYVTQLRADKFAITMTKNPTLAIKALENLGTYQKAAAPMEPWRERIVHWLCNPSILLRKKYIELLNKYQLI